MPDILMDKERELVHGFPWESGISMAFSMQIENHCVTSFFLSCYYHLKRVKSWLDEITQQQSQDCQEVPNLNLDAAMVPGGG